MSEAKRRQYHGANLGIVLASLVLIAFVWAAITQRLLFERRQEISAAVAQNATLAVVLEEQTIRTLEGLDQVLRFVKRDYEASGKRPAVRPRVEDGAIEDVLYNYIEIADDRGGVGTRLPAASRPSVVGRDYFAFFEGNTSNELFIGKPSPDPLTGRQVVPLALRLDRPDGSFNGVAFATVNPAYFTRLHRQARLGDQGLVSVVGLDGIARARRFGTRTTAGEDLRGGLLLANQARIREGNFVSGEAVDGVSRFHSYRTLADFPLVVAVATSEAEILAPYGQRRRVYLVGASTATALVLCLAGAVLFALRRQRREVATFMRSESRFRATFDQAFVGMIQLGIDGRLLKVNQTICGMLGYSQEELLARTFHELVHPKDRAAVQDDSTQAEVRFLRKDGTTLWTNTAATLVRDPEGKPDFRVTVVQDITEFKRIDRMKTEFVSTVSHELRTPLTSIRGSLGLIAGGVAGPLPDAVAKLVDIAKSNCERLIRLINDILDSEKIASGKMQYDLQVIEVEPLVREALAANEGFARQGNVTFELHAPADPLRVHADHGRLIQVLTNLLSNAVQFSPAGAKVEVDVTRDVNHVRVEVRDHGAGIPEEFRARIFQRFSQADSSDTRLKGGTGLGLNISKSIIEHLGGTIGFRTSAEGTTFHFELPQWDYVPPPVAARPCILVCEDDPDIARLIGMMLDQAGFDTELAGTAAQAAQLAAENSYAAMTLDIRLPDADGMTLVHRLRENTHTFELPIVVVSAVAEKDHIKIGHEAFTISDWLDKPIDENRLVLAIRRAIEDANSVSYDLAGSGGASPT